MVAIKWSFRLLGLISTMVLARLLAPEDFGIVAIAMALIGILDAFFDFGFDLALIKNQNATPADYDAAWTLRVANMALFGLSIALLSPLMAAYSSSPETIPISLVLALSIALRGLTNIGTVDFQKDMEFSSVFKLQVLSKILATGTTITLAFLLRSYWAIVIGFLTSSIYMVSFSYLLSPYRPRLRFKGLGQVWSFSKWILLTNMARQLFISVDKLLLSGLVSKAQLGFYNVSNSLASIITIELLSPIGAVLMPGFAKLQHDRERLQTAFIKSFGVLLAIIMPAGVGVWLTAPELVSVILGNQWRDAAALVAFFGIFSIFASLSETLSNFMAMTGLIATSAWIGIARTCLFLLGFYFAFQAGGLYGVLILKTMLALIEVFILFQISAKFLSLPVTSFLQVTWRPTLAVIAMVLALHMLTPWLTSNIYIDLAAKISIGSIAYVLSSLQMWRMAGKPDGLESLALDLILNKLTGRTHSASM